VFLRFLEIWQNLNGHARSLPIIMLRSIETYLNDCKNRRARRFQGGLYGVPGDSSVKGIKTRNVWPQPAFIATTRFIGSATVF
jgi:hypothetical protein